MFGLLKVGLKYARQKIEIVRFGNSIPVDPELTGNRKISFWLFHKRWLMVNDIKTGRSRVEESPHFYGLITELLMLFKQKSKQTIEYFS